MIYADEPGNEGKAGQADAAVGLLEREGFWADTCREATQMQHQSKPAMAMELYRKYGCRFCQPERQQIQYVLNALDAAVPGWEKEHPELFYQTLELNYPELVRHA
jgi:hypothetical protein